ncbi:MAG: regulatory protein RecX [Myxococcota bacterium]
MASEERATGTGPTPGESTEHGQENGAESEKRPRGRRRAAKKLTQPRLERAALHYVERFAPSRAQLVRFLERRVSRARRERDDTPPAAETDAWVAAIVAFCERHRYVDDARYARSKARTMRARGDSARKIRARLATKGVRGEVVDAGLAESGLDDRGAAARLARRRRLGPFRREPLPSEPLARAKGRRKELGVLARAGFGHGTARAVLEASRDDAEAWAEGETNDG